MTPWKALCVDFIGPYTLKGKDGSSIEFICLTMINPATSWFEIVELPTVAQERTVPPVGKSKKVTFARNTKVAEPYFDKSSAQISNLVYKTWFCRYRPCCQYIIYDNGSEFKLHFQSLCKTYGIKRKPTSVKNLGWQCRDLCLSALPPKWQTFSSVADMSQMSAQLVGNILLCRPIFWLSVLCWGILLPNHYPIRKQESVLVRYILLLLHACRNLFAIKLLSHSPPFDQRNWAQCNRWIPYCSLVALGLKMYKTPQLQGTPQ